MPNHQASCRRSPGKGQRTLEIGRNPEDTAAKPSLKRRKTNRTATAPNQTTSGTFVLRFTQAIQSIAFPAHDYSSFPKMKRRWNLHHWAGFGRRAQVAWGNPAVMGVFHPTVVAGGRLWCRRPGLATWPPTTPANAARPAPGRFSWSCPISIPGS